MSYWTLDGTPIPWSEELLADSSASAPDPHNASFRYLPGGPLDSSAACFESTTEPQIPFYSAIPGSHASSFSPSAPEPFVHLNELEEPHSSGNPSLPRLPPSLPSHPRQSDSHLPGGASLFYEPCSPADRSFAGWDNCFNAGPYILGNYKEQDVPDVSNWTSDSSSTPHPSTSPSIHSDFTNSDRVPQSSVSRRASSRNHYSGLGISPDSEMSNYTATSFSPAPQLTTRPLMAAAPTPVEEGPIRGPISESYNLPSYSELYTCEHCDRSFQRSSALKKHAKTHDDQSDRPYSCEVCSFRFYYLKDLDRHKRSIHRGEYSSNGHSCKVCERKFIRSDHLQQHYKIRHPDHLDLR